MAEDALDPPVRCQAQPAAVRLGFREDKLCASMAKTVILFHGREMPVCWMHLRVWERWGADATKNAVEYWAWLDGAS